MTKVDLHTVSQDVRELLGQLARAGSRVSFVSLPRLSREVHALLRFADVQQARAKRMAYEREIEELMHAMIGGDMLTHRRVHPRQCPRWLKPHACRQAGEGANIYIPRFFQKMAAMPELQRAMTVAHNGKSWAKLADVYRRWRLARRWERQAQEKAPAAMRRLRQIRQLLRLAVELDS